MKIKSFILASLTLTSCYHGPNDNEYCTRPETNTPNRKWIGPNAPQDKNNEPSIPILQWHGTWD